MFSATKQRNIYPTTCISVVQVLLFETAKAFYKSLYASQLELYGIVWMPVSSYQHGSHLVSVLFLSKAYSLFTYFVNCFHNVKVKKLVTLCNLFDFV